MAENQNPSREFALQRVYIKDLSFETPHTPDIFRGEWQPETSININNEVNKLADDVYEVVLTVTVTAKSQDKTAYLAEVKQAAIVGARGFSEQELGHMLGAYCPNVLFPYVREAVSDLVTKGSFPQMLLAPVNFDLLYAQHQAQLAQQAEPPHSVQ
jgi:preprotein translocase subunit SecB